MIKPSFAAWLLLLSFSGCLALGTTTQTLIALQEKSAEQQEAKPDATELFSAAQTGDIDVVKQALEAGVDVNAKTKYNATALSFAAEKGHLEIVKLLLEKGADPNVTDTFYNASPLVWARMGQHKEIVEVLEENGAKGPTLRADPERSKKKAKSKAEREAEAKKKAEEEAKPEFPADSPESRVADRRFVSNNWPQFRGTGARGIADGQNPPQTWNAEEAKNLLWKTAIPGLGHSCPVIYGEFMYLTSAISSGGDESIRAGNYGDVKSVEDDSEHRFVVYCINKRTGEIVWEKESAKGVPKVKRHLKSTHANCTVATNGTHVVAFFAGEGLYCYDTKGQLLWEKDLGILDSGWFYDKSYQWGYGSSPIIFEDKVILQCDIQEQSFVTSLNLNDGSQVWRVERDEIPGWSTPTVVDSPRGPMLVTHATGFARGYDARTGEEWWRFGKHSEIVVPTPFTAHDMIYITSGYRPIQPTVAISLDAEGDITLPDNETSGEHVKWYRPRGGPYMPSAMVYGDYMYLCSNAGVLTVLQAKTGQQVYRERLSKGIEQLQDVPESADQLSMVGSPVAADGVIYFPTEFGVVYVLKAGPEFKMLAANLVGENILTTPAISEGVFFVRGQKHLFAFGEKE